MADIELVIKMPEEEYKNICLMSKDGIGMALYDWIANGTPLPKGHGRLIDADKLNRTMYHKAFETDSDMQKWDSGCWIRYKMFENSMKEMPTVIEADKGE